MSDEPYTVAQSIGTFGPEWHIAVPGSHGLVAVAVDVYGEAKPMMQLLVEPPYCDDLETDGISIRFNPDGRVAEVVVPDGMPVRTWGAGESNWLKERDGC